MPKSMKNDELQDYLQTEKGQKELIKLSRSGKTLDEISRHFGITRNTLYRWSKKYPEIQSALTEGKQVADDRVVQSLYECCFGRDEKEITLEKDVDGNIVKQVIRTKYIPPNPTAIQYWLSNRRSNEWKARQQLEMSAENAIPIVFKDDLKTVDKPTIEEIDD